MPRQPCQRPALKPVLQHADADRVLRRHQDDRFLTMNRQYDASLRRSGISHIFHTYQGGHTSELWRSQAPTWLAWALRYLAAGRARVPHPAR